MKLIDFEIEPGTLNGFLLNEKACQQMKELSMISIASSLSRGCKRSVADEFRIVERGGRFYPQHRWMFRFWDIHNARYEIDDGVVVVPGALGFTTPEEAAAFIRGIANR